MKSKLYIVSTPIGNYEDITLRALNILRQVDFIVCEEFKPARRLLSQYDIQKELISLNEHNEKESTSEIITKILKGQSTALISDAGTPLFSDPGSFLIDQCILRKIKIIPVPGANSLLSALVGSGLKFEKFYYFGWLSPKREVRQFQLKKLRSTREILILLETPYRLAVLLRDVELVFGKNQKIVVAYKLTQSDEKYFRGKVSDVLSQVLEPKLKGEFVLLIDNQMSKIDRKKRIT